MKSDYKITRIHIVTENGFRMKRFTAQKRINGIFQSMGNFSVPSSTPNGDLWKVIDEKK